MLISKGDRLAVLAGTLGAWVLSLSFVWLGVLITDRAGVFNDWSAVQAAAFALLMAGLTLAVGIGWAAGMRYFVSNIDGSRPETGSALDIALRYVSNTTEQLVLFSVACAGVTVAAPEVAQKLLPVLGCWFVLARIAFLFGYLHSPLARSVGFAATFHPTLVTVIYALWAFF